MRNLHPGMTQRQQLLVGLFGIVVIAAGVLFVGWFLFARGYHPVVHNYDTPGYCQTHTPSPDPAIAPLCGQWTP
jgi:hypothetical protein